MEEWVGYLLIVSGLFNIVLERAVGKDLPFIQFSLLVGLVAILAGASVLVMARKKRSKE